MLNLKINSEIFWVVKFKGPVSFRARENNLPGTGLFYCLNVQGAELPEILRVPAPEQIVAATPLLRHDGRRNS